MANRIHPTAVIGPGVELGDDNVVGPYAVLVGPLRVGDRNWIGPHATIGTPPEGPGVHQPVAWEGELDSTGVVIGDGNVIREYVSIPQGSDNRETRIGDTCFFMAGSHVGHDSHVGDGVTVTSSVQIAGHCTVWSWVNLGLGTLLHQRTEVGPGAMVGMGSVVRKTVDPFSVTAGNPARTVGMNVVGLSRRGCPDEAKVEEIRQHIAGRGPIPEGLPAEMAALLKLWDERPRGEH